MRCAGTLLANLKLLSRIYSAPCFVTVACASVGLGQTGVLVCHSGGVNNNINRLHQQALYSTQLGSHIHMPVKSTAAQFIQLRGQHHSNTHGPRSLPACTAHVCPCSTSQQALMHA